MSFRDENYFVTFFAHFSKTTQPQLVIFEGKLSTIIIFKVYICGHFEKVPESFNHPKILNKYFKISQPPDNNSFCIYLQAIEFLSSTHLKWINSRTNNGQFPYNRAYWQTRQFSNNFLKDFLQHPKNIRLKFINPQGTLDIHVQKKCRQQKYWYK